MKISAFADVGLRVMLVLSGLGEDVQLTTKQLAEGVGVPYNHVSKTVARLGELGFVETARGRSGGSRITEQGRRVSLGGALRSLDSRTDVAACTATDSACPLIAECRLRFALRDAQEAFYRALDGFSIGELATTSQLRPVFATIGIGPPRVGLQEGIPGV